MSIILAVAAASLAIVALDNTSLRAAPKADAALHAQLAAGDLLEVRGQRLGHVQVYDHRRERAGYVRASQVRPITLDEAHAPELLSVVRFVKDTPGAEPLGIAYVAAYLKAAPAQSIGAEAFDALGVMAERLARRASMPHSKKAVTSALETVATYGVTFSSLAAADGSITLCYEGEAFRRVLADAHAPPEAQARAALASTRADCVDPALPVRERAAWQRRSAQTLDRIDDATFERLADTTKQRLRARRASVWASIAFDHARAGEDAQPAARRAVHELAAVKQGELADDDGREYADAALRVGASRWGALPRGQPAVAQATSFKPVARAKATAAATPATPLDTAAPRLSFTTHAGDEPGQTCVQLATTKQPDAALVRRCTYGVVWLASARVASDDRIAVLAVQPMAAWTELWVFRAQPRGGWRIDVLPPATAVLGAANAAASHPVALASQGLGYIEFAGFVPGQPKLLVAREARIGGKLQRRFEVLKVDEGYAAERWASDPALLVAFGRWADAGWKQASVSLR